MQDLYKPCEQTLEKLDRQQQREAWLGRVLSHSYRISALTGDASFRQYFRIHHSTTQQTWMFMDAPPPKEDCRPFIAIAQLLEANNVRVPHIIAHDSAAGFVLLEDFGDQLLMSALNNNSVDGLYRGAMQQILAIQTTDTRTIPRYDKNRLIAEMQLFHDWFLPYLDITPSTVINEQLLQLYTHVAAACERQHQVFVHRDFHCRNLMVLADDVQLGVIDFQDALRGPVTYDLVSLLRDAYVVWSVEHVRKWVDDFANQLRMQGLQVSNNELYQQFNMMGVQRHLKVLGIFVRLSQRDGKHGYLNDLALVLWYLVSETAKLSELNWFHEWLVDTVQPAFLRKLPQLTEQYHSYCALEPKPI